MDLGALAEFGFAGAIASSKPENSPLPHLHSLSLDAAVSPGDAIRIGAGKQVNVLYRWGANANTLFVTEQCNSLCLMCSQPPRDIDDAWRIQELIELLPLLDKDLPVLGVTGGEPTLLGTELIRLLMEARRALPDTHLHVLSNGRGERPHSSLKYQTPAAYAATFTATGDRLRNPDQLRRSPVAPPAPIGVQPTRTLKAAG